MNIEDIWFILFSSMLGPDNYLSQILINWYISLENFIMEDNNHSFFSIVCKSNTAQYAS